jgi:hypothetical protein
LQQEFLQLPMTVASASMHLEEIQEYSLRDGQEATEMMQQILQKF